MLTIKQIEKDFNRYNALYWDGKLKKPTFEFCHRRNALAGVELGRRQKMFFTDVYELNDKTYKNTLLHEMIHLYVTQNYIVDDGDGKHGTYFHNESERLNKLGWNIKVSRSFKGLHFSERYKGTVFHMVAMITYKGKYFLMRMSESRMEYFKKRLEASHVKEWIMFDTTDEKYIGYVKRNKRFRGDLISQKEYEEIKKTSYSTAYAKNI